MLIIIIIGIMFTIIGLIMLIAAKSQDIHRVKTDGQIIGMCKDPFDFNKGGTGDDPNDNYWRRWDDPDMRSPIFNYWVEGILYQRADTQVGYTLDLFPKKMNKERPVYYDPEHPEDATLFGHNIIRLLGVIFFPIGLVLLLVGLLILLH